MLKKTIIMFAILAFAFSLHARQANERFHNAVGFSIEGSATILHSSIMLPPTYLFPAGGIGSIGLNYQYMYDINKHAQIGFEMNLQAGARVDFLLIYLGAGLNLSSAFYPEIQVGSQRVKVNISLLGVRIDYAPYMVGIPFFGKVSDGLATSFYVQPAITEKIGLEIFAGKKKRFVIAPYLFGMVSFGKVSLFDTGLDMSGIGTASVGAGLTFRVRV